MKAFETNKKIWSDIYKAGTNNLAYPNENLVRYLYYLYPDKNFPSLKVLDYGFGSGNNLKHLDQLGCDVFGVEISEHAKNMTLEKIRSDFNKEKLFIMQQESKLPYEHEFFDLVISWQVLYYNTVDSFNITLDKLYNALKVGGKFIGTIPTMKDISSVNSTAINTYERISKDIMGNQAGSIIIAAPTEEDVKMLFSPFKNIKIGYFETKLNDIVGSHWVIYGEK